MVFQVHCTVTASHLEWLARTVFSCRHLVPRPQKVESAGKEPSTTLKRETLSEFLYALYFPVNECSVMSFSEWTQPVTQGSVDMHHHLLLGFFQASIP